MKKQKIEAEAEILNITMKLDKNGEEMVHWTFPYLTNAYFLIGILEDIKKDILDNLDNYVE